MEFQIIASVLKNGGLVELVNGTHREEVILKDDDVISRKLRVDLEAVGKLGSAHYKGYAFNI